MNGQGRSWGRSLLGASLILAGAGVANAASVTYVLDQTNADPVLADGVNYLQVTISDATFGGDANAIRFDVTALGPLTDHADDNFGIQAFGFNSVSDADVSGAVAGLPAGWTASAGNTMSAFGVFDVRLSGTGSTRQDPTLTFFITGIDGDTLNDYATLSGGNAGQGNQFFAAHVAGFADLDPGDPELTSAFFAGPGDATVIPLPATAWLIAPMLGVVGWFRRRR
jgi:hypothetical protein